MSKLCELSVPSSLTISYSSNGGGGYSKTFSSFYDFNLYQKKCSIARFAKTSELILNEDFWCLYEGGPNGRVFGYLPTNDTTEGQGLAFGWIGSGSDGFTNAMPCLTRNNLGQLIENTQEGLLRIPEGAASLSPINPCVFGFRDNGGIFPTKTFKNQYTFSLTVGTPFGGDLLSSGSCMPYNGQTFPVDFGYGGSGTGTYSIEIMP